MSGRTKGSVVGSEAREAERKELLSMLEELDAERSALFEESEGVEERGEEEESRSGGDSAQGARLMQALERENRSLRGDLKEARARMRALVAASKEELSRWSRKVGTLEQELEEAKVRAETAEKEKSGGLGGREAARLRGVLEQVSDLKLAAEADARAWAEERKGLKQALEDVRAAADAGEEKALIAEADAAESKLALRRAERALEQARLEVEEWKEKKKASEEGVGGKGVSELEREREGLVRRLEESDNQVRVLSGALSEERARVEALRRESGEKGEQIRELEGRVKSAAAEVEEWRQREGGLESEFAAAKRLWLQVIQDLKAEMEALAKEHDGLKEKYSSLLEEKGAKEEEAATLRERLASAQAREQSVRQQLQERTTTLSSPTAFTSSSPAADAAIARAGTALALLSGSLPRSHEKRERREPSDTVKPLHPLLSSSSSPPPLSQPPAPHPQTTSIPIPTTTTTTTSTTSLSTSPKHPLQQVPIKTSTSATTSSSSSSSSSSTLPPSASDASSGEVVSGNGSTEAKLRVRKVSLFATAVGRLIRTPKQRTPKSSASSPSPSFSPSGPPTTSSIFHAKDDVVESPSAVTASLPLTEVGKKKEEEGEDGGVGVGVGVGGVVGGVGGVVGGVGGVEGGGSRKEADQVAVHVSLPSPPKSNPVEPAGPPKRAPPRRRPPPRPKKDPR